MVHQAVRPEHLPSHQAQRQTVLQASLPDHLQTVSSQAIRTVLQALPVQEPVPEISREYDLQTVLRTDHHTADLSLHRVLQE